MQPEDFALGPAQAGKRERASGRSSQPRQRPCKANSSTGKAFCRQSKRETSKHSNMSAQDPSQARLGERAASRTTVIPSSCTPLLRPQQPVAARAWLQNTWYAVLFNQRACAQPNAVGALAGSRPVVSFNRCALLTLGTARPQLLQRMCFTVPRPWRFLPPLRRFFVIVK